jgi:hypothetical protein
MKFWRRKEKEKTANQPPHNSELLNSLRSVSIYFERNIKKMKFLDRSLKYPKKSIKS